MFYILFFFLFAESFVMWAA